MTTEYAQSSRFAAIMNRCESNDCCRRLDLHARSVLLSAVDNYRSRACGRPSRLSQNFFPEMTLSPAWLDELRARTILSAVIAPSVKLIRAGREFKACCPFHNEKTPSFTVNDDKGFYHCFGCGAHGDAIRFLTDHRGMPFMDAVKELASKAGMDIPAPDPRAREQAERSASLTDLMGQIAQW